VCDRGRGLDPTTVPQPREEGGWGLLLVQQLTTRWGIRTNDHTCVWAEMNVPNAEAWA
jgi:hypothetical protein